MVDIANIAKLQGVLDPNGKYANPLSGLPYSENYVNKATTINPKWSQLRTFEQRMTFFRLILNNQVVVCLSGTGTGKTVVIPRLLHHSMGYKKTIYLLNPKVAQCVKTAESAAEFADVKLGQEVGHVYQLNGKKAKEDDIEGDFDEEIASQNKAFIKGKTKVIVCTDRWMIGWISGNPDLPEAGGVILDEIHLRTIGQDFLLTLFCNIALRRPDFRILIMSATLDSVPFIEYFTNLGLTAKTWVCEGEKETNFDITRIYSPRKISEKAIISQIEPELIKVLNNPEKSDGNIIIFVPSVRGQIEKLKKKLTADSHKYSPRPVFILFGSHTQDDFRDYVTGNKDFRELGVNDGNGEYQRMVIFSTEVGEASITFKDISCVIDSGMINLVAYNPKYNATVSGNIFIAQSNIGQRCGRTGRTMAGDCIALYAKEQYSKFIIQQLPEIITKVNLITEYLDIITHVNYGSYNRAEEFFNRMLTPPSHTSKYQAMRGLVSHGLVDIKTGAPTDLGRIVSRTKKLGIPLCKIIIAGLFFTTPTFDCLTTMTYICAILMSAIGSSGLTTFFKENNENSPNFKELEIKKANLIAHFTHPQSDHITALKIYLASRNPAIFYEDPNGANMRYKQRNAWCEDFLINHKVITKIDENVADIKKFINLHRNDILNLDMLKIVDSKYYMSGGGKTLGTHKARRALKFSVVGGGNTKQLIFKYMDKLTLQNLDIPPMTSFKNPIDNILACLFFGYINNIGISENSEPNNIYLVKNSDMGEDKYPNVENMKSGKPVESIINNCRMVMFNDFSLRTDKLNSAGDLSMVSELPEYIIQKFIKAR
jgi:pre-mRNA-splicing factor ATP-dependent RNA helicase DHX15/PRP43